MHRPPRTSLLERLERTIDYFDQSAAGKVKVKVAGRKYVLTYTQIFERAGPPRPGRRVSIQNAIVISSDDDVGISIEPPKTEENGTNIYLIFERISLILSTEGADRTRVATDHCILQLDRELYNGEGPVAWAVPIAGQDPPGSSRRDS